jgi:hypothetical protein
MSTTWTDATRNLAGRSGSGLLEPLHFAVESTLGFRSPVEAFLSELGRGVTIRFA